MKTIELTDELYEFMINVAKEMATQGNRATEFPLFCVYQKKHIFVPEGCGDAKAWAGGQIEDSVYEDDVEEFIKDYKEENPEDKDLSDEEIFKDKLEADQIDYKIEDVPVDGQVYLTEKAAQQHIDENSYHYSNPFVYVVGAWRNAEIEKIMQLFALFGPASDQWRNAYRVDNPPRGIRI